MDTYCFGDARIDRRGNEIFRRILATNSLVLRRIGGERGGEVAAGRFLASPRVSVDTILAPHRRRTREAAGGRTIVVAQDTTEVNFSGRDRAREGLGPAGDGKSLGFFIHAAIAVDADEEAVLGVVDARIWTRTTKPARTRHNRPVEEKETMRWLDTMASASDLLAGAATRIVHVADRESDFYAMLARVPEGSEMVIRARHDRALEAGGSLFAAAEAWPDLGVATVAVSPRGPGDRGRTAQVVLRARRVRIRKPEGKLRTPDPDTLEIGLVEAREIAPPAGVEPVHWRLLTTLPVASSEQAREVVRLYRLRWRIEQTFRALKSDGLALEETQVEEAGRLFELAALGLAAAVRNIQLVDARDGSSRPASDVIEAELIEPAAAIGRTLEGRTPRQKNPHPPGSLAWLSWIVARLGGWNCYYKPPGPKTMATGWRQLMAMLSGYTLAAARHPRPAIALAEAWRDV